jgi:hypothetical protein
MASPYSPPDVEVQQLRRTRTSPRLAPQQPLVVIGPARQIVTREEAGTYEAGEEFQARLPGLATGAKLVDGSVQVLLNAVDVDGKALGLFQLSLTNPADAEILADGETLRVYDTVALEYSLLSARNNDQPDSIANDDAGQGTPDGVWFTDEQVDFMSRGVVLDNNTFITISAPASMAGRYRLIDVLPTGNSVYTVKVLKVDESNVPELDKTTTLAAANRPTTRFVYGFPATHFLSTVNGGAHTSNVILSGGDEGVGVTQLLDVTLDATAISDLLDPDSAEIPAEMSGDAVWFSPGDPGDPADLTGRNLVLWRTALQTAQVGDWVRFAGDFGGGTAAIRDFKILAIDTTDWEIQLQNPDLTGTGVFTLDKLAGTWPDITSIKFLRVARGRQDQANAAGDYLTGSAQGVPFNIEILKATPGYVELAAVIPTLSAVTNTSSQLMRGIPFRGAEASYDIVRRITEGFSGAVQVSYKATRTDLGLGGLIDIASQAEIKEKLGVIHPDNPIALMADMVTRSGLTSGSTVFYAMVTDDDTLASHQAAIDALTMYDVHKLVPATDDPEIIDLYIGHVLVQSQPENKHERTLYCSPRLPFYDQIIPADDVTPIPQGTVSGTYHDRIGTTDPLAIDWGAVRPGMVVKILASNAVGAAVTEEHRIREVNSALGYAVMLDEFSTALHGASVYFRIDTAIRGKSQLAEYMRDEAKSIGESRVRIVRPDEGQISYTDETETRPTDKTITVPGYFLAAAVAGKKATLKPQLPMTNVPIPGIARLSHSNDYFTPDQLNTIAEGGNALLIQSNRNAAPYLRHQLTSDMSAIETQEWSLGDAIDYAAAYLREILRPYIGKHVINSELLTQLRGICEAALRALKDDGVILPESSLDSLMQDPDRPDGIIIEISCQVPYPCNKITVKLYS